MPGDAKTKVIGRSVKRLEDRPLLTGRGRFAADISFPDQLHMRIVRSSLAHGTIELIDTSAALKLPGVHAVWTAKDVSELPPIGFRLVGLTELEPYRQFVLAKDVVRYVGEPVAVVFASDAYIAEDAADLVQITASTLPAITDVANTAQMYGGRSSEATVIRKGFGDIDAAFRNAQHIVSLELSIGRHTAVPIETRGILANYDEAADVLKVFGAAKVPHWNRDTLAKMLGRKPEGIQLFEGHVGGGFGVRGEIYPEDVIACYATLKLRRPIKWIEDRREHLIAANHSRQQRHKIRAAVDKRGQILGIDDEFFHDNGAYMRTHAATVPDLAAGMLPGPYRMVAYRSIGHIRLSNKTPCGTYRAPGRYESTFVRERLMDAIAAKLGVAPLELRRRNLIPRSAMPYDAKVDTLGTRVIYDSGDYARLIDTAKRAMHRRHARHPGDVRRRARTLSGRGSALFVEKSGFGPSDLVKIAIMPDGAVEVVTGAASVGQGIETVIAQICADTLGADYETTRVIHGQTDRIAQGGGAYASRVTVMTGEASRRASEALRAKALAAAAALMQTSPDKLDIAQSVIAPKSGSGASMTFAELARARPNDLDAEGFFEYQHMVYPYGLHHAQISIDPDTGGVTIERYFVAYDVGRAVNPMLIEGQIAGGVAQGIGGALYEEFLYDSNGEPLSVTFADYLMPTAHEIPEIGVVITEDAPSPLNTLGLKGAGEGGVNAVGAAIAAAIDDALGMPGAVTELPVTPQRIRALLRRR
ncbi:MAG: xanthine dehydrogenase family protein molybdopterin-binding subunit [Pseudolabrys sp.]|nr:xanthine dehydrogenase family protein molybdopterin-binding subunit [Pseudolabrys sp.]